MVKLAAQFVLSARAKAAEGRRTPGRFAHLGVVVIRVSVLKATQLHADFAPFLASNIGTNCLMRR
jgi:hypothetical protein